jgi:hypothetical protein
MLDFETIYKKHGEDFIWNILHIWEKDNKVQHFHMTLEQRWEHFILCTDTAAPSMMH